VDPLPLADPVPPVVALPELVMSLEPDRDEDPVPAKDPEPPLELWSADPALVPPLEDWPDPAVDPPVELCPPEALEPLDPL
jgi:hypothetical protein